MPQVVENLVRALAPAVRFSRRWRLFPKPARPHLKEEDASSPARCASVVNGFCRGILTLRVIVFTSPSASSNPQPSDRPHE